MSVAKDGRKPSMLLLLDPRPFRGGGKGGGLIRPGMGRFTDIDEFLEPVGVGRSMDEFLLPKVGAASGSGSGSSIVGASSCEGLLDVTEDCLRIGGGGGGFVVGRAGSAGEIAGDGVLILSSLLLDGIR